MLDRVPSEAEPQRWELPGPFGVEEWQRSIGRFTSALVGRKRLTLDEQPFDLDQLRLRQPACGHAGPWPYAFQHCPECGVRLLDPAPLPPPAAWAPPSGAPSGLAVQDAGLHPVAGTRQEEAMPPAANLSFIVAGRPPHLFAYDLQTGWLRVRNEGTGQWDDLRRLPAAQALPRWSWAAAISAPAVHTGTQAEGFVLPTDQGPVLVRTGPATPLSALPAPASLGIQAAAGGAACLRGQPFMPVRLGGGLGLACLSADGDAWELQAVLHGGEVPPGTMFAAPVTHADDAFWCAPSGQLSLSLTGGGGLQASWQPWPDGLTPVLGARPLQEPNGSLHQLMHLGDDRLVFASLDLPGRRMQQRPTELWLSAGNAAFRDGMRRRLPWDEAGSRAKYVLADDEFLLPLLAFGERRFLLASCTGRDSLTSFLDTQMAPPARRACRLLFTPATLMLEPLQRSIDARSAWDIVPFVFRDRLHIYAANTNQCWSWELRPDAAP